AAVPGRSGFAGPRHGEAGPAQLRRAVDRCAALVQRRDAGDDRETQAEAPGAPVAAFVEARERAEHGGAVLLRDALAVVLDHQSVFLAVTREPDADGRARMAAGVDHEVAEGDTHEPRIHESVLGIRFDDHLHLRLRHAAAFQRTANPRLDGN